jgi:hypothetical protein
MSKNHNRKDTGTPASLQAVPDERIIYLLVTCHCGNSTISFLNIQQDFKHGGNLMPQPLTLEVFSDYV